MVPSLLGKFLNYQRDLGSKAPSVKPTNAQNIPLFEITQEGPTKAGLLSRSKTQLLWHVEQH